MSDRNREVIALLDELRELMVLDQGSAQSFRVRAYENAVHELELVRDPIEDMSEKQLVSIDGIGKSTAKKIREYFDRGTIAKLEELRAEYPAAYVELSKIPGLGPKGLKKLRTELGVVDMESLRAAIAEKRVRGLAGFGKKSEEKLAHAIERSETAGKNQRRPIAVALPLAEALVARLEALDEVESAKYCGSLRRFRETVADIDIVVTSETSGPVMDAFVGWNQVSEVLGHGETKSAVITTSDMQIDLRVVSAAQRGAALLYFTGSKAHNIALRQRAIERGWTLNEYGLTDAQSGDVIARESEEDIYRALGMALVPPPMREDTGEVARAAEGSMADFAGAADMRGDGHLRLGPGIDELLAAVADRGDEYAIVFGNNVDECAALHALAARAPLRVFTGLRVSVDIAGQLQGTSESLKAVDFVLAHLDDEPGDRTRRLITAIEHPAVRAVSYLTGRTIGATAPAELDVDAVLEVITRTGTALELTGELERLDPPDDIVRRASERDVPWLLSSRASAVDELARLGYACQHAQRGWVTTKTVVNSWPADKLAAWLRRV